MMQSACCCAGNACQCLGGSAVCAKLFSSRILYAFGFIITGVFALILFLWGGSIVGIFPGNILTKECPGECFQFFAPYKICLALVAYHGVLMLILVGANTSHDPRFYLHQRFWPL